MLIGFTCHHFAILENFSLGMCLESLKEEPLSGLDQLVEAGALGPLNCLAGRSSTGKSSVFQALHFVAETVTLGANQAGEKLASGSFEELISFGAKEDEMNFQLLFYRPREDDFIQYEISLYARDHEVLVQSERADLYFYEGGILRQEALLEIEEGSGTLYSYRFRHLSPSERSERLEDEALAAASSEKVELIDQRQPALSTYGRMLQHVEICWLYRQICNWFITRDPFEINRLPSRIGDGIDRQLNSDFSNARNVIAYYQERAKERGHSDVIAEILKKIPDAKLTGDGNLDRQLTSGNLKLFLYYLLLEDPHSLICIDTPELGLYHEQIEDLIREMRIMLDREPDCQILLSSHNNILLDNLGADEVFVMERQEKAGEGGEVRARWLGQDRDVRALLEEGIGLGNLWYSGHLSPTERQWFDDPEH